MKPPKLEIGQYYKEGLGTIIYRVDRLDPEIIYVTIVWSIDSVLKVGDKVDWERDLTENNDTYLQYPVFETKVWKALNEV
jgi:hypothetical protein